MERTEFDSAGPDDGDHAPADHASTSSPPADPMPVDSAVTRPAEPTTPAQRERRHRIIVAAMELLDDRSYDDIQMRDVSDRGVAGTMYRYFLQGAAVRPCAPGVERQLRRRHASPPSYSGNGRRSVATGAAPGGRGVRTASELLPPHRGDGGLHDPAVVATFSTYGQRFVGVVRDALTEIDPADVPVVTMVTNSLLITPLRCWWLGHHSIRG